MFSILLSCKAQLNLRSKDYENFFYAILLLLIITTSAFAWDGYDYDQGAYIEIDKGNLVRAGETIEIYDYNDGTYKDVDVESVNESGSSVEIEVYDPQSGGYRTFDME